MTDLIRALVTDQVTDQANARLVLTAVCERGWRIVRPADDDPHYVTFSEDGWAIEHSGACRNAGSMLNCPLDIEVRQFREPPLTGLGRYRIVTSEGGYAFETVDDAPTTTAILITEEWTPDG